MKKEYSKPEIEFIELRYEDVIIASVGSYTTGDEDFDPDQVE